jgi:hypothetical protein
VGQFHLVGKVDGPPPKGKDIIGSGFQYVSFSCLTKQNLFLLFLWIFFLSSLSIQKKWTLLLMVYWAHREKPKLAGFPRDFGQQFVGHFISHSTINRH